MEVVQGSRAGGGGSVQQVEVEVVQSSRAVLVRDPDLGVTR